MARGSGTYRAPASFPSLGTRQRVGTHPSQFLTFSVVDPPSLPPTECGICKAALHWMGLLLGPGLKGSCTANNRSTSISREYRYLSPWMGAALFPEALAWKGRSPFVTCWRRPFSHPFIRW
ncbi:hypothetical protein E2C01_077747 [Portunus trituberculatus]|uniref:Uncharacterized protein n=1 Tax=Portunus trituberculatus TaxID=210409 RepID=A0A5B7IN50_PORTR|nr:hypothetical protein [Portunus trituberculatus]